MPHSRAAATSTLSSRLDYDDGTAAFQPGDVDGEVSIGVAKMTTDLRGMADDIFLNGRLRIALLGGALVDDGVWHGKEWQKHAPHESEMS